MENASYPLVLAVIVSWVLLLTVIFRQRLGRRNKPQDLAALPPTAGKPAV